MRKIENYDEMTKDEIIQAEREKLGGIYNQYDSKTKKSVSALVNEAAWMSASLYELRKIVNEKGYTEIYQNGANQHGTKKCSEVELYNTMIKNYSSVVKQLTDLLPRDKKEKTDEDDGFANFVTGRKN